MIIIIFSFFPEPHQLCHVSRIPVRRFCLWSRMPLKNSSYTIPTCPWLKSNPWLPEQKWINNLSHKRAVSNTKIVQKSYFNTQHNTLTYKQSQATQGHYRGQALLLRIMDSVITKQLTQVMTKKQRYFCKISWQALLKNIQRKINFSELDYLCKLACSNLWHNFKISHQKIPC